MSRHAFAQAPEQFRFIRTVMDDVDCEGRFGVDPSWDIPCAGFVTLNGFDHSYPAHDHATLSFVECGTPMTRIGGRLDGKSGGTASGALLLYSGGYERHWLSRGYARSRQFYINQSLVRECGEELGSRSQVELRDDRVFVEDVDLRRQLKAYYSRSTSVFDPPTRLEMDSRAALITLALVSRHANITPRPIRRVGLAGNKLRLVLDLIEERLVEERADDSLKIADLARLVDLGVRQFSESFREALGTTPHRYVVGRQIERAKCMLSTKLPMAEIAVACGFSSQQHFVSVFRKIEGITPGRYRAVSE